MHLFKINIFINFDKIDSNISDIYWELDNV